MPRLTRLQAIKAKCLDCSGFQPKEVKLCPFKDCPLWIYRLGHAEKDSGQAEQTAKNE